VTLLPDASRAQIFSASLVVAAVAASALAGCTFGDEAKVQQAKPVVGEYISENCVPKECLYACCPGADASPVPSLYGGSAYSKTCTELYYKIAAYREYYELTLLDINYCDSVWAEFPWGDCKIINPLYVQKVGANGQREDAGLVIQKCQPSGQPLADDVEDVELAPQD
jgi:hypothetical protein